MTSRMTATDELRRLLDGRGVEWGNCVGPFPQTAFSVNGVVWQVKELVAGLDVSTRYLTPEQAVEATLGRSGCVYVLTAIDPGDGREYTLGIYATKELAEKSAETDGRGYVLHDVSRWEVVDA